MIRRTYHSPDPANKDLKVGDSIASLYSRQLVCSFDEQEKYLYDAVSEAHLKKLITVVVQPKQMLVWNRKHARQLQLNTSWIGFAYIGNRIMSKDIPKWKQLPNILFGLLRTLDKEYDNMIAKGYPIRKPWTALPDASDTAGLIRLILCGAPKFRVLLRVIAELVVLREQKIVLWSALFA